MTGRTSTIRAREIGHQLRRYREHAGYSQRGAGQKIELSTASICRMEDGTKIATPEDVAALLALYDVQGPARETLLAIAREADQRGWLQHHNPALGRRLDTLRSLESRACGITTVELQIIPGLLQIPEYATALTRTARHVPEPEVQTQVRARMSRRHVLFRDDPVELTAFIDETALLRPYGSAAVLHRQLGYLLTVMERCNIIVRIIPLAAAHRIAPPENFLLLRFSDAPTVVHVENRGCALYFEEPEEIALYDDAVRDLLDVALDTGESAGLMTRLMRTLEDDPDVLPKLARPALAEE